MENRAILVLGSDLAAYSLVRGLCLDGVKGILAVDSHIEPGGYLGTQHGVGFRYEKLPLLISEASSRVFEEHGFQMVCKDVRVGVAKLGDHVSKALCWKRLDTRPWWYPDFGGRLCYPRGGWGRVIRSILSSTCSEYTYYLPRRVDVDRRIAVLRNGRVIKYRVLISSLPLPLLLESLYIGEGDKRIQELIKNLNLDWVDMLNISLGIRGSPPEYDIITHGTMASRTHTFYIWSNIDPLSSPPGHYLVEMLMSYCRDHPPPTDHASRAFAEARWAKLVTSRESIASERIYTIPYIQPIAANRALLTEISEYLGSKGIYIIGVGGSWENMPPEKQLERGSSLSSRILKDV
ncbi:MAG: hypothetical protein RQ885_05550 [Desulfurococcales archaeon]|jgi:hypothetical protein|nr:hypothetical protein [Desulfurococcales archaeon]